MRKTMLGKVAKEARNDMRYSQEKLAELLDVSTRHIRDIETGKKMPSYETLYALITTLGIDANQIFYPEKHMDGNEAARMCRTLERLLNLCDTYQLQVLLATASALLNESESGPDG